MNDLDKKLEAYYTLARSSASVEKTGFEIDKSEWVSQVRQAFIDDGWLPVDNLATAYESGKARAHGLMTKEEWEHQSIIQAMKKTSGLE